MSEKFWSAKRIAFVILFAVIGFAALHIHIFRYEGLTGKFFTWFEFIGPLAGAFLGPVLGFAATFLSRLVNFVVTGAVPDAVAMIPLFTLAFASFYFGTSLKEKITGKIAVIVPLLAITIFLAHPVGQQVWYFALFWLIPIAALFTSNIFAKALGATFTAHAVGGSLWIWAVPFAQNPGFWNGLIFIVPVERLVYAIGIVVGFVAFNTMLARVEAAAKTGVLRINPKYVIGREGVWKAMVK